VGVRCDSTLTSKVGRRTIVVQTSASDTTGPVRWISVRRMRTVEPPPRPAGWQQKLAKLIVLAALVAGVIRALLER